MSNDLKLWEDKPVKLITSRRAVAAGIAALIGAPTVAVSQLKELSDFKLGFDPVNFKDFLTSDGICKPDYRYPMVRICFANGTFTQWHRYNLCGRHPPSSHSKRWDLAKAIEICCADKNGFPRYAQLEIA